MKCVCESKTVESSGKLCRYVGMSEAFLILLAMFPSNGRVFDFSKFNFERKKKFGVNIPHGAAR